MPPATVVAAAAAPLKPLAGVTVVLDPGHGGEDSGAICAGVREDVINYRIAATVGAMLQARGANVVYTVESAALRLDLSHSGEAAPQPPLIRPHDARLTFNHAPIRHRQRESPRDLYRRARVAQNLWQKQVPNARSHDSIYFLSLHCDKLDSARWHGARVYSDAREKQTCRFAQTLQRRLTNAGFTYSNRGGVIPRSYGVLNPRWNPVPQRALLEVATISSARDRKAVQNPVWRRRMAALIVEAIMECACPPA